jgi:uncharacterized MAPEG superfamily protein
MKRNLGNADRLIRVLLAVFFAVLFFNHLVTGVAGAVLIILAVVFLLTSMVGFCPLYAALGIKINASKKVHS